MNKCKVCIINFGLIVGLVSVSSAVMADNGLEGRWRLQDIKNTPTILDDAIDEAASEMNFAIWLFNQSFLENEKKVCEVWRLRVVKTEFHWKCDDGKVHKMPITANQLDVVEGNGVAIEKTFEYTANHISTRLKMDHVSRTNVWKKLSDVQMQYTAIIESANLPEPLKWSLIYKKH